MKSIAPIDVTLDIALALLALPREIGNHPETGEMISAGIGRFGPYIKLGSAYVSLGPDEDVLFIGLNRAVTVIKENPPKKAAEPLRKLGTHPADGKPVNLYKGPLRSLRKARADQRLDPQIRDRRVNQPGTGG